MKLRKNIASARITIASIVTLAAVAMVVGTFTLVPAQVLANPVAKTVKGQQLPDDAIVIEEVKRDGDRALLRIRNRTPFIIIVYIGGVRIGWMRPYRVGMIRGLTHGYHRMYAHSRYGTTSWGPRHVWIPGTWNLLY
jgi:hypothetical protein